MLSFLISIPNFLVLYSKLNFRILLFLLVFAFSFGSSQPAFEFSGPVGSQHVGPSQMVVDGAGANGQVFFNRTAVVENSPGFALKLSFTPLANLYSTFIADANDDSYRDQSIKQTLLG